MMKNFWFVTLCAFLIASLTIGMSLPLRIAIGANAVLIIMDAVRQMWRICRGRKKEEN